MSGRGRFPRAVLLTLALTAFTIAVALYGTRSPAPPPEQTITIRTNTQATVGDVRVGAGNIREESSGRTAGLWISTADPRDAQHVRVHAGQELRTPKLTARVVDVRGDSVTLALPATRR